MHDRTVAARGDRDRRPGRHGLVVPEKKVAFRVDANKTVWSYELEPTATGTRLVETRNAENGVTAASKLTVNALFGGVPSFEQELVAGMNESLAKIKAAAER